MTSPTFFCQLACQSKSSPDARFCGLDGSTCGKIFQSFFLRRSMSAVVVESRQRLGLLLGLCLIPNRSSGFLHLRDAIKLLRLFL